MNLIGLIFNDRIFPSAAFPWQRCLRVGTRGRGPWIIGQVLRLMLVAPSNSLVAGLHGSRLLESVGLNGSFYVKSLSAPRWAPIDAA